MFFHNPKNITKCTKFKLDISRLTLIKELTINKESIHITKKTKLWCSLPYKNNKKGCPNFNKNPLCPPNSPFFINFIDDYSYFYIIYSIFAFKKYKEIRKLNNPNLTDNQISCVLYWQGSIKRLLKDYIKTIYNNNIDIINSIYVLCCGSSFNDKFLTKFQKNIYSMESVGIDVFRTLKNNNIKFEIKPKDKVLLVCLLCSKIEINYDLGGLL